MSFSLALKRSTASNIFNRLLNPIRSTSTPPFVNRTFGTQMSRFSDDDEDEDDDSSETDTDHFVSHRGNFAPRFYEDVIDPLATRSLTEVFNLMDRLDDLPLKAGVRGSRSAWDVKEDDESLSIRVDMPGLDKKDVKICVDKDTLIIKGEGEKEDDGDKAGRMYSSRIDLPRELFKLDEIKAEMKNGVVRVRVPKVKEEDREGVFQVKVD